MTALSRQGDTGEIILKYLAGLAFAALACSFLGFLHPVGDSLAVFRAGFALLALSTTWPAGFGPWVRRGLQVLAVAGLASVGWYKLPVHDAGPLVVYQKNMFFKNDDMDGLDCR